MTATIPVPEPRQASPVGNWKKRTKEPIELPSGEFMRIRRMSMSTLMATGKIPNSLIGVIKKSLDKGVAKGAAEAQDEMGDLLSQPKVMQEMGTFLDDLIVLISLEPKVMPTPKKESDRLEDVLYADEVDEDDKSYLFGIVSGGPADLAKFREATAANVAALSGLSDLELPAERTAEAN